MMRRPTDQLDCLIIALRIVLAALIVGGTAASLIYRG